VLAKLIAVALLGGTVMLRPVEPVVPTDTVPPAVRALAPNPADIFQFPLPSWQPHCLGFGSQWRYCNGTPLRACASGAVWLHTGVDIRAVAGQPVVAAGDGVIAGYIVDPVFHGGVLVRHRTSAGVFLTQYWHVWLRPGFKVGTRVKRGQAFADVASMGDKTHFHFAVFKGDFEPHAWNGALPPSACAGFPAFPYRFVDPNAFIESHEMVAPLPRGTRTLVL
jgi:murein DD-endopeptidase MepM/ murein hydrolase activator NlpD